MTQLIKYEEARAALAKCYQVDEVKAIRDKAEALRAYGRQAKDHELETWAAEIKVRAQRRIGEISRDLDKAPGPGRGKKNSARRNSFSKKEALAAAGLSEQTAHRCEQLAAVPETVFEAAVAEQKAKGQPVFSSQLVNLANATIRLKKVTKAKKAKEDATRAEYEGTTDRWRVDGPVDCLDWFAAQPADSVDLVFASPPYERARLYLEDGQNLGISRDTDDWVRWMVDVTKAALRVCTGLVAFVVQGQTKDYRWSAAPALFIAALVAEDLCVRMPPIYHRVGIPGSGGPDWLRNDYEFTVCAKRGGKLPWSENTAMGQPPKYKPGGQPSHRTVEGSRVNGEVGFATMTDRNNVGPHRARRRAGREYQPPEIANPGNVIDCAAGGGNMGDNLCHDNEAPFPEYLAEFFIRSFCPPGGVVCDPFVGSGTTGAVARRHGRRFVGCDLRASQVNLSRKRIGRVQPCLPRIGE